MRNVFIKTMRIAYFRQSFDIQGLLNYIFTNKLTQEDQNILRYCSCLLYLFSLLWCFFSHCYSGKLKTLVLLASWVTNGLSYLFIFITLSWYPNSAYPTSLPCGAPMVTVRQHVMNRFGSRFREVHTEMRCIIGISRHFPIFSIHGSRTFVINITSTRMPDVHLHPFICFLPSSAVTRKCEEFIWLLFKGF